MDRSIQELGDHPVAHALVQRTADPRSATVRAPSSSPSPSTSRTAIGELLDPRWPGEQQPYGLGGQRRARRPASAPTLVDPLTSSITHSSGRSRRHLGDEAEDGQPDEEAGCGAGASGAQARTPSPSASRWGSAQMPDLAHHRRAQLLQAANGSSISDSDADRRSTRTSAAARGAVWSSNAVLPTPGSPTKASGGAPRPYRASSSPSRPAFVSSQPDQRSCFDAHRRSRRPNDVLVAVSASRVAGSHQGRTGPTPVSPGGRHVGQHAVQVLARR